MEPETGIEVDRRQGAIEGTCWREDAAGSEGSAGKRKIKLLGIGTGNGVLGRAVTCYLERNWENGGK